MLRRLTTGPRSWSRVHTVARSQANLNVRVAELMFVDHEQVFVHSACRREAAISIRFCSSFHMLILSRRCGSSEAHS